MSYGPLPYGRGSVGGAQSDLIDVTFIGGRCLVVGGVHYLIGVTSFSTRLWTGHLSTCRTTTCRSTS